MLTKEITLNDGSVVVLFKKTGLDEWTSKLDNIDRLDVILMSEDGFECDGIVLSRNEIGLLNRYIHESTTLYSIQKIRQLAKNDLSKLRLLITTIKEIRNHEINY